LLKCDSAAYGCIGTATGDLRFRAAHKLPARPSMVRELARRICSEVIAGKEGEAVCEFSPTENSEILTAHNFTKTGFKSFLGYPVTVNGQNTGALVALHTRSRKFSEQDRWLIALLASLAAIEDSRYRREKALSRRISLEKMLKDLSTQANAIEDTSAFIEHCLEMLGTRMGVGGSFLWEFNPEQKTLSNTYDWLAEGQTSKKPNLQNIPIESLHWGVSRLMKGDVLRINDVKSIPANRERELLEEIGVRACLIIPLFSKDVFYGFIGLECYNGSKFWASEDVLILQTAADIIMRCIENGQLKKELIENQRNLEKAVGKKTLALRKVNERLSAEIAAHKGTFSNLKNREAELDDKNKTFMELNNALAALLNKPENGLGEAEECMISKLNMLIDHAVTSSVAKGLSTAQDKYIGNLRDGLKELSSLLKTKSSFVYQCLTPMEIKVADLIKQGKGNKEIADLLNLSRRTIEVHRYNIRKKIDVGKMAVNLKTYLMTMD
jgi:GAF domain-containing protein/DNA-binding CsgD family transcriptional regulator